MMDYMVFSAREIGGRERLEDYALHETLQTAGGMNLQVILACDGSGGGDAGERASRMTARTILDYLEVNDVTNIPRLMVEAVEEANRVVYSELRGAGISTVAMVVVDRDDGEYGRAFIASVGDSRIYLIRERELVRLNIDHTLANEYVYAGQMSENEAQRLENANYPTRVIGVNPEIQVDIGFYVERGNPFVNAHRAFNIGKHGMLLREGDTLFAASQAAFEIGREDGTTAIRNEEFLRHAMDDNAERAVRSLLRYAVGRQPEDNVSLALLFVPSRFRRPVRVTARLSPAQRLALGLMGTLFSIVTITLGVLFLGAQEEARDLRQTESSRGTAVALASALPSSTPTATLTPTLTPTFTPTPRPTTVSQEQIGNRYFVPGVAEAAPVLLNRRVPSAQLSYVSVLGLDFDLLGDEFRPAAVFLMPEGELEVNNVVNDPNEERFTMSIYPEADTFTNAGQFVQEWSRVEIKLYEGVVMETRTQCYTAKQIPPDLVNNPEDTDKIAFACLTGQDGDCTYTLPGELPVAMPIGRRVLLDLDKNEYIIDEALYYEEMKLYYDSVQELTGSTDAAECLIPHLDIDGDGIPYPNDLCENVFGTEETNGCPDDDGDGIANSEDACPSEPGPIENRGCPLPTATPIADSDGDGYNDVIDLCPDDPGVAPDGCPLPIVQPGY